MKNILQGVINYVGYKNYRKSRNVNYLKLCINGY